MAATAVDGVLSVPDIARRLVQLGMPGHRTSQGTHRES
jgi:hypothetical protein